MIGRRDDLTGRCPVLIPFEERGDGVLLGITGRRRVGLICVWLAKNVRSGLYRRRRKERKAMSSSALALDAKNMKVESVLTPPEQ